MTLEEMLKLLGITEKDANAIRLIDGVVPSVDFVDLGANGTGESGFLVKKGRRPMKSPFGKLTVDDNGNFVLTAPVAKGAEGAETEIAKLSKANKAALAELVTSQETQLEALKKALSECEEDDAAEDMPEQIKTMLAGLAKGITVEEPAAEADPEPDAEPTTAEPAAKSADADADDGTSGPDPVPAEPGTFEIGDLVLTGNLATTAKAMAEAAGEEANSEEFAMAFQTMAALQAKFSPSEATTQAVATVNKRMDAKFSKLEADNAKLQATLDAVMAGGFAGPVVIPDGTPQPGPTKKSKPALAIPCGQPIGNYIGKAGEISFTEG
jgi:hypothetical protein